MQDQIIAGILHSTLADSAGDRFFQLFAPLKLLHKALEFNQLRKASGESTVELYIAQSLLADLPTRLQQDVPTPTLVLEAGKGDVYSSSIWLGTEPTYTPLHRDPNPNLFCQLHNQKVVRLLPPQLGEKLYLQVQVQLRLQGSSRMRGVEMMEGEERKVLQEAVWEPETPIEEMCEAELDAGDALFIPEGWWHSVKSSGASGDLNGSVNWWFR
ncbi:Lysine-specific demethylase 8 [Beauveria bassiana D1-5]|nr:JmjC domain-containing protein [Beauveria bassiana ARSEF 2860]EJP67934.1 JmjC domain-containing protein [Beauveria bassiana ARSEF 2860]KGQ07958.1 Lysine-specific demethylase 8 [Beauveria bassiana D1-5]